IGRHPSPPLFPYTTLFRSARLGHPRSLARRSAVAAPEVEDTFTEGDRRRLQQQPAMPCPAGLVLVSGRGPDVAVGTVPRLAHVRSEEHTSELQSQSNLVCR